MQPLKLTFIATNVTINGGVDFNEARDDGMALLSPGPYPNHLHLAADR